MFNFWWLAGLVVELEPHMPPLSRQRNKMLIFGLHLTSDDRPGRLMDSNPVHHPSPVKKNKMLAFGLCLTSDDWLGWSMDLNPICHPSPAKKIKCSFLDYVQLLMIGWAGRWTWTTSATLSSQINKMLVFGLHSTSDDRLGWSIDSNPIRHPSHARKIKCSFLDYVKLLMIGQSGQWTRNLSATPLQSKE